MMTRAEIESAIERHGEKAEIISLAREVLALFTERDDAQARVRELEATTTAATIRAVRKALGATVGQSVVTRAEEVMEELVEARRLRDSALGRVVDLEVKAAAAVHPGQARTADLTAAAVQILSAVLPHGVDYDIEDLAKMAADRLRAAEAEPPQVFRIIPRVTVDRGAVRFDVVTTDPGILALTAVQLSQLGLVVCDG